MSPPVTRAASPGDSQAAQDEFFVLYRQHGKQLLAWLSSRVASSDLDDVHQDIWAKVWAKKQTHFHGGNFRAWLFALARNHLIDLSRQKRPTPGATGDDEPGADPAQPQPCDVLVDRERVMLLEACLARLAEPRRRIVEARLAGHDYEAIAASLAISTAQAHSHFFAAKKQLQACLEGK